MRSFSLIAALLMFLSGIPPKAAAQNDSARFRHRISVLPTQLLLREFSIFYEYSLTPQRAMEFSLGYQIRNPEWDYLNDYSPDWGYNGVVMRGNFKFFSSAENPRYYVAPMGLVKLLAFREMDTYSSFEQVEWEHMQFRTVLGAYGLIGYRSRPKVREEGKLYIDFYMGLGGRFILEHREVTPIVNGQPATEYDVIEPRAMPDVKFGLKIGACYSALFKSWKR